MFRLQNYGYSMAEVLNKLSTFLGLFVRRNKKYNLLGKLLRIETLAVFILEDADTASTAMYNLKSSLHVTVCRSDLAKKTFS